MIKDYRLNDFESVDFEINDAGTSAFSIRLFGDHLNYLFADMALYSDSGRTTALSGADWEISTNDATYTALEAGAGGSGKTISSEIKILNATYQTGTVYARCNNFGTYASGGSQGVSVITLTDSSFTTNNYDFTIDPGVKKTIIDCSAVTAASQEITMIQGTHPCGDAGRGNIVEVVGSSTVQINVVWSGGAFDWWLEAGKTVEYFFDGSDLMRGPGMALEYDVPSNTGAVNFTDLNTGGVLEGAIYEIECVIVGNANSFHSRLKYNSSVSSGSRSSNQGTSAGNYILASNASSTFQQFGNSSIDIKKIWRLYE